MCGVSGGGGGGGGVLWGRGGGVNMIIDVLYSVYMYIHFCLRCFKSWTLRCRNAMCYCYYY